MLFLDLRKPHKI